MTAAADDTIFAVSSGRPPAAIAVVRISGPRAGNALKALCGKLPEPRRAMLARVREPQSGEVIDEALALWFPGPNSETGEDTAELQVHGGRAVIAAVLGALGRIEGLRPAEAGEFTRRAFENGRLDLTAVEGLADLIDADTEAQRRQAYRQLKGLLGNRAEAWRTRIIEALALVEARIDFSDEADVPEDLMTPALEIASALRSEIGEALAGAGRGERLRDGLVVAIAGPPNAGKSTLLNRIARRDVAIVSPVAGTTRDVIEVHLDLHGYPVTLLDTAGMRDSDDPIEQEGVRRAQQRAAEADLVLWTIDAAEKSRPMAEVGQPVGVKTLMRRGRTGGTASLGEPSDWISTGIPIWLVQNKIDALQHSYVALQQEPAVTDLAPQGSFNEVFSVSSLNGHGLDNLLNRLEKFSEDYFGRESSLLSRARHRAALDSTHTALGRALDLDQEDLVAEELRQAALSLGRLTGRVDVEDILDVIFREFCIGK